MIKPTEEKEVVEIEEAEEVQESDFDLPAPQMNLSTPQPQNDPAMLIPDDKYLQTLEEIMDDIREDRKQVADYVDNFADMVINDGDASTSSKEALVNLVKIKTDMSDKMIKIADLMTRLKAKNTYAHSGAHMNAVQQNNYNFDSTQTDFNRKELIRAINHAKKKKD